MDKNAEKKIDVCVLDDGVMLNGEMCNADDVVSMTETEMKQHQANGLRLTNIAPEDIEEYEVDVEEQVFLDEDGEEIPADKLHEYDIES